MAKQYQITVITQDKKIHERYLKVAKQIKTRGISIGASVPGFLVDSLEAEEAGGFEGLKKYI
jgi:hypothetical protein